VSPSINAVQVYSGTVHVYTSVLHCVHCPGVPLSSHNASYNYDMRCPLIRPVSGVRIETRGVKILINWAQAGTI